MHFFAILQINCCAIDIWLKLFRNCRLRIQVDFIHKCLGWICFIRRLSVQPISRLCVLIWYDGAPKWPRGFFWCFRVPDAATTRGHFLALSNAWQLVFLADRTYLTVELIIQVVRLFVCQSVCYRCIVAKLCEIGPRLLLITNRKSHIDFQIYKNHGPRMTLKSHN